MFILGKACTGRDGAPAIGRVPLHFSTTDVLRAVCCPPTSRPPATGNQNNKSAQREMQKNSAQRTQ
jgi:hypothetical protein